MQLITYHLGGPQVDEQVVIHGVGVALGVFPTRQTMAKSALQN